MANFVNAFFRLPRWHTLGFNIIILFLTFILLVFVPQLRLQTLVFAVMFLLAEAYKPGQQTTRTPLIKGLMLFFMFAAGTMAFVYTLGRGLLTQFSTTFSVSVTSLIIYYLVAASAEEDVFRSVLPKVLNSPLLATALYSLYHLFAISILYGVVGSWAALTDARVIGALLFTFLFGLGMYYLTHLFKSTVPAKAVHWVFNLFQFGVIMSLLGGAS